MGATLLLTCIIKNFLRCAPYLLDTKLYMEDSDDYDTDGNSNNNDEEDVKKRLQVSGKDFIQTACKW